jgi:hypothetical protein
MTSAYQISGRQGAAALVTVGASFVWVAEILRWTIYNGKVPGSHMPDWMTTIWMLCLLGTPIVSVFLALIIGLDQRERFTSGFSAAIMYGCSPGILFAYYLIVLG